MKEKKHISVSSSGINPEDDAPDLTTIDLSKGWFETGGRRVSEEEGKAAFRKALKEHVNVSLDSDVAQYFQASAGREGIQAAVNRVLREHISREVP